MAQGADPAAAAAIAWLERGLVHLAPSSTCHDKRELRRLKALCEIGFLTAMTSAETGTNALAKAVIDRIEETAAGGRFLGALWQEPEHANLYLPLLYCLALDDRLDAAELADLARLLRTLDSCGFERIPFRSLDFLFSRELLTGRSSLSAMEALAAIGCLRPGTGLANCSRKDRYAMTHTIFYLTAFGSRAWPRTAESREPLLLIMRAMRFSAESEADWDLYSEFLACEAMLGSPAPVEAVDRLLASQNQDGSWTGPADLEKKLDEEGITPSERGFYSDYHTTLVAWLALRIHHDPGFFRPRTVRLPLPAESPRSRTYAALPPAWVDLLDRFDSLGPSCDWTPPAEELAGEPQGVLPYLEWHYWRGRLDTAAAPPEASSEIGRELAAACLAGSWRQLRCLLLLADGTTLDRKQARECLETVVAAVRAWPLMPAGDPALVDLLVCASLLQDLSDADSARQQMEAAVPHLLLALLERKIFAVGPLATFLRPWLDDPTVEAASDLLEAARAQSLPFGFMVAADEAQLRRSLACETYLHQLRLSERASAQPPVPVRTSERSRPTPADAPATN